MLTYLVLVSPKELKPHDHPKVFLLRDRIADLNSDDTSLMGKAVFSCGQKSSLNNSSAPQKLRGFSVLLKDTPAVWTILNTELFG